MVPGLFNFIFPLWESHSRILFLSQTNEVQRVHYVASSKQEAGVTDWGKMGFTEEGMLGASVGRAHWRLLPPTKRLCSAWAATPSDQEDQASPPHLASVLLAEELLRLPES